MFEVEIEWFGLKKWYVDWWEKCLDIKVWFELIWKWILVVKLGLILEKIVIWFICNVYRKFDIIIKCEVKFIFCLFI